MLAAGGQRPDRAWAETVGRRQEASAPKLDPLKAVIDEILRADLNAPRKQRHIARRVLARLVDEHDGGEVRYLNRHGRPARRRPAGPWTARSHDTPSTEAR